MFLGQQSELGSDTSYLIVQYQGQVLLTPKLAKVSLRAIRSVLMPCSNEQSTDNHSKEF